MRARDFIREDEKSSADKLSQYSDLIMVLGQIQATMIARNLKPQVSTDTFILYVQNAGLDGFSFDDLIKANDTVPAVKEMIKNINYENVTINLGNNQTVDNPNGVSSAAGNPEQTVSNMAKSAMTRRQG